MTRLLPITVLSFFFATTAAFAEWSRVAEGIDYQKIDRDGMVAHVTRIDVTNPAVKLIASSEEDVGLTVSALAEKRNAIVAINGDYFDEKRWPLGKAVGVCGLWAEGAKLQRRQGLVAVGERRADIQSNTQETDDWMRGAVSGWPMLVDDCEPIEDLPGSDYFTRAPHPRTAVGISSDGRQMFFVVSEGRREGVKGLTLPELAGLMHELGACEAINLDGGGSSAMWVDDEIVNDLSDGRERRVGNHLAVISANEEFRCEPRVRAAKR